MTERVVPLAVRNMLVLNQPFDYCHLIKFERPSLPDSYTGKVSTSKERYTYITDSSIDVNFDDNSTSLSGVANGAQTYRANKVLKVGTIVEEVEARASTFSLELDGTAIGASVTGATVTTAVVSTGIYDVTFPATVDLIEAGFREGDKVTITGNSTPGDYNVDSFRSGNVLRITKIDTTLTADASVVISMTLASEEIRSVLLDKTSATYASFINREVYVYKAFFQDGAVVGTPFLIFKGLVSNMTFDDNDALVRVTWGLTSHWGDWQQVAGRITSDDFHRALDENGNPNPLSSLKPLYAYDKGFTHAEISINTLAKYTVMVEKQDVSVKKSWFGLSNSVKVKKYLAPEDRTTQLDIQLQAKSIPVIYGVRPIAGIPIFADTLNADSSTVYVAYALSEGEIGGIYDVYIGGNSLICNNKSDFDARSAQTKDNTVPLVCIGRADKGDVLGGISAVTTTPISFFSDAGFSRRELLDLGYNAIAMQNYYSYTAPTASAASLIPASIAVGIKDGESLTLTSPQAITLDFFSGKAAQKAASSLVNIAASNGFKIQNSYWTSTDTAEYWGPNHRLLDTAYVVGKFKIAEGETTIPDLTFIVNGKVVPCYNYDYSYSQWIKGPTAAGGTDVADTNFLLGDIVTLYDMSNTVLNASVQIIDKWSFANPDGTTNTRFRFGSSTTGAAITPSLGANKQFYMQNASSQKWTMVTYDYQEQSGSPQAELSSTLASAISDASATPKVQFTFTANTDLIVGGDGLDYSPKYSIVTTAGAVITNERFGSAIMSAITSGAADKASTRITTSFLWNSNSSLATAAITGNKLVSRNTIKLAASASATNDFYKNYTITLSRTSNVTGRQIVQSKIIVAYDGTTKIATIDGVWDSTCIPTTTDSYYLTQPYVDHRITTNFALQALDYVTSTTYGRGLTIANDIDLPSWQQAGRDCDARSDVTVRLTSSTTTTVAGDVYKLTNTAGKIIWQGTVSSTYTSSIATGSSLAYVVFTNVIGKLTNLWNSWRTFNEGEYVYYGANLYKVAAIGTVGTTAPTHTSGTVNNLIYQASFNAITKVSGTGPATLTAFFSGNPVQSIKLNRIASGYSLYDSDGIDYWRYVGWTSKDQRFVTRHQGNLVIDTSQPVFDNINNFLGHFGGILRYSSGKYYLEVENTAGTINNNSEADSNSTQIYLNSVDPYNITEDHIIGKIALVDEGIRSAYNSLAVSYADPSNKFEARNISFFNSTYLTADRNVPKKGNLSIPGITNYYNARLLADRYLNKSRFGLSVSLTIIPRGILLVPGQIIQIQYSRYGWVNKKFRLDSVTIHDDCLVDITAREYDDSLYDVNSISRQSGVGSTPLPVNPTNINGGPTNLVATSSYSGVTAKATVVLNWTQGTFGNSGNTTSELYSISPSNSIVTISSNTCTTTSTHGFVVGDLISAFTTTNGLTAAAAYYINAVTTNTFTLVNASTATISVDSAGVVTVIGTSPTLTNGTGLTISVGKQVLLDSINYPLNTWADVINTTTAVTKFYRVRNKVTVITSNGMVNDQYSDYNPTLANVAIIGTTVPQSKVIVGYLTNEAATFQADNAGTVSDFTPGNGTFKISADEVDVSTGAGTTYALLSNTGCTASINGTSGVYSVTAMSTDNASATFTATYSGTTVTKVLALSKSKAGSAGSTGSSVYVATIYQQVASLPATPVATASTYNFSTNTLTPPSGWVVSQPATSTTPTYACDYTFTGAPGSTVTGVGSWGAPYIIAVAGSTGSNGEYRDIIELYQQAASAPTQPTSVPYTFSTNSIGTVTGGTGTWSMTKPTATTVPIYATRGLANTTTPTVAFTVSTWSTPIIVSQVGTAGNRTAAVQVYQWNTVAPAAPSGTSTYTWSTGTTTLPSTANSWALTPGTPTAGQNLYVAVITLSNTNTTTTDTVTWTSPTIFAISTAGATGTAGYRAGFMEVYKWSATTPTTTWPTGTSVYTWATGTYPLPATPNGWSLLPPAAVAGQTLYAITVGISNNNTTATDTITWPASPTPYAIGAAGTNGGDAVNILLTNQSIGLFAYADGSVPSYAGINGTLTVYSGATDVTASATLSATGVNCTGTINTAVNTPVTGVKGYYQVTAVTADAAQLNITVVYNSITYTRLFTINKVKTGYEIVATLPATGNFVGRMVFLTTDNKLYRYNGTTFTSSVPTTDLSGTIADAQIAAVAATKLTGSITTTQITDGSISTAKIAANAVTAATIAANTITSGQIAANTITAGQIAANTITASQLAAGTITANEIAAGTITAAKIASNTITASQIAANTITASQIASATITANEIAATTITAAKLNITDLSAISANLGTISVTNANIANLTVGTTKITDNAVTAAVNSQGTPTQCGVGYFDKTGIGSNAPGQEGATFTIGSEVYTFRATPTVATDILITTDKITQFAQIAKTVNANSTTYSVDTALSTVTLASGTQFGMTGATTGAGIYIHLLASNTNTATISSTWSGGTQTIINISGGSGVPIVGFGSLGAWATATCCGAGTAATRLTTTGEAILITGSFGTLFGATTATTAAVECLIYRSIGPVGAPAFSKQFLGNGTNTAQSNTIAAFDSGIAGYSGLVEYRIMFRYYSSSGSSQHTDAKSFDLTFLRIKK